MLVAPDGNIIWHGEEMFNADTDTSYYAAPGLQFGTVAIVIKNAAQFGYGYVFIDGEEWRQGGTSATPMRTQLPLGQHRIRIVRDGFLVIPRDTVVTVEREKLITIAFSLRPLRQ